MTPVTPARNTDQDSLSAVLEEEITVAYVFSFGSSVGEDSDQSPCPSRQLRSPVYDDLDPDSPRWHYDLEIRHSETADSCLESTPAHANSATYVSMVTPVTMVYDVEKMTRIDLFNYVNAS
ncbi:hypothetical protein PInf_030864 [Phytophthora infestans]|nr:hypothetical protein PInf_030864 [Phytophthora infestans]